MKKSVFLFILVFFLGLGQNLFAQEESFSDSLALLRQELRSLQQKYDRELLKFDSLMMHTEIVPSVMHHSGLSHSKLTLSQDQVWAAPHNNGNVLNAE